MASDKYIAQQSNKTSDNTSQLGRKSTSFSTLPTIFNEEVEVWDCRKKETSQLEGSVFTVGHPTYSKIGPSSLSGAMPIGPNVATRSLISVTNAHNLFPEYFDNDRFIDEVTSTGSYNEGSGYYLDGSEIFQSDYIAYEDKVYKFVKIKVDCEDVSTGSNAVDYLNIYAVINGSDYLLSNNIRTSINNISSDGLKIKIENNSSGNSFPLTFPITFLDDKQIKLNNFFVTYSE